MIAAVIYDMDGVIIESEPLWCRAETLAFQEFGIPLTEAMCSQTMGLRVDEVVRYWAQRYPVADADIPRVAEKISENILSLVKSEGQPMPGVRESLRFFQNQGLPLALASSSRLSLINTVLDKLGLRDFFTVIHSAEHEPYGKPHPGVYMTAAEKLGVSPGTCLAIEDSFNGMIAAKAAKMTCLAVPDPSVRNTPRLGVADRVLSSLSEINQDFWQGMLKAA